MKLPLAAIALAIVPQALQAAEVIGTRGDWEVFRDSKSCGMTRTYEGLGDTEMMVIKYAAGNIRIMITNTEWSAKQDARYDISYIVNGATYGGAKAVGTAERGRKGFVSTFVGRFAEDFAEGSILQVLLAGEEIERLSLAGSGTALALVDQCLVRLRADLAAAERERARRSNLPRDPFAPFPEPRKGPR
ncbi:hypothetical protein KRR38_23165 [Novosphingobium sp. G106]|uniref:hypothetical protein n=1 Tax=Novosphingobium sp. G106 TaxID=2849500 RepID=UPI001C2D0899|nr:hypothetical protein [Novosphingobium sp. G106]MBV1690501.1 hypothetical protein [Novosphingobium sp. G106]